MSHIDPEVLSAEILSEVGALSEPYDQEDVVDALATAIATVFNDAEGVFAASWTPVLQLGGSPVAGAYTEQQGRYWTTGDLVIAVCKVKKTSVSTTGSQTVRIAGLPHTAGSELAHWPTWMSQSSLLSGDVHARLAAGASVLDVNEDQRETTTSWNFTNHTFFAAIGVAYKKA